MAETRTHACVPPGSTTEDNAKPTETEGAGPLSSDTLIFEKWLKAHLGALHQEVLGEPLPAELSEIVERLEARRRRIGDDRRRTTVASGPMTPLP